MTTYTIIVGRPDYVSDNPLTDTYMTSVEAENAADAGVKAVRECAEVDSFGEDDINNPDDYVIVAVIAGEHSDIQYRTDL